MPSFDMPPFRHDAVGEGWYACYILQAPSNITHNLIWTGELSMGSSPFFQANPGQWNMNLCDWETVEPLQIPNIFMINVAAGNRSLWNISWRRGAWNERNEHFAESNCLAILTTSNTTQHKQ